MNSFLSATVTSLFNPHAICNVIRGGHSNQLFLSATVTSLWTLTTFAIFTGEVNLTVSFKRTQQLPPFEPVHHLQCFQGRSLLPTLFFKIYATVTSLLNPYAICNVFKGGQSNRLYFKRNSNLIFKPSPFAMSAGEVTLTDSILSATVTSLFIGQKQSEISESDWPL
jgi:hypothetical protein